MSDRIRKLNKHIQRTFGEVLQEEADLPSDILVTIARVDTAKNLQSTTVWLYIFPLEQAENILKSLKSQIYDLQGSLNKKLHLKPLPRLLLRIDYGAQHAEDIDRKLSDLSQEEGHNEDS